MSLRRVTEEVSTTAQLQEAAAALRAARAKSAGLREAARAADDEVKAASREFRHALTAHTGLQFNSGSFGEGLDLL